MRVSKVQAAQNRTQILTAAGRLFREQGVGATGVDSIAGNAGLTHGAVYSQFGSKEAIAAEAIRLALMQSKHLWQRIAERKGPKDAFPAIVDQYLSPAHRDSAGRGCVFAALACEVARQPASVRDVLTGEFKDALEFLAGLNPADDPSSSYDDAIATFVSMTGALILARAVNDRSLSNRILKTTAERLTKHSGRPRLHTRSPRSARPKTTR